MRRRIMSRTKKRVLIPVIVLFVLCLIALAGWFNRETILVWMGQEEWLAKRNESGTGDAGNAGGNYGDGYSDTSKVGNAGVEGNTSGAENKNGEANNDNNYGNNSNEAVGNSGAGGDETVAGNSGTGDSETAAGNSGTAGEQTVDEKPAAGSIQVIAVKQTDTAHGLDRELVTDRIRVIGTVCTGDYVDIRLRYPNGEDYVVLSHRKLVVQDTEVVSETPRIGLLLEEQEIIFLSSAITEASGFLTSELYLVRYPETSKESSVVTYLPKQEIITMLLQNELLNEANAKLLSARREELDARLEQAGAVMDIVSGLEGYRFYE